MIENRPAGIGNDQSSRRFCSVIGIPFLNGIDHRFKIINLINDSYNNKRKAHDLNSFAHRLLSFKKSVSRILIQNNNISELSEIIIYKSTPLNDGISHKFDIFFVTADNIASAKCGLTVIYSLPR